MGTEREVAQALLRIHAVGFNAHSPVTFKTGIVSPVYVDNRTFPFHPDAWGEIIRGFESTIKNENIVFDVLAGIESAGIPHSAALGFAMQKPSLFIRKQPKDHGLKKRVEGGEVSGRTVLLVEDLVSTGSSSLSGVEAIRAEGGTVRDCLVIVSYGFPEAHDAFKSAGVQLHALTTFSAILEEAEKERVIDADTKTAVEDWLRDPHGWGARRGVAH